MHYLLTLLCLLLSPASLANSQLTQLETQAHKLSSSFASFIYFQGQNRYLQQAIVHAQQGQKLTTTAIKNKQLQQDILNLWQRSLDFINENKHHSFNGIDMRLEASWSLLSLELSEQINEINNLETNNSSAKQQLQLELAKLLAQYMKLANSTVGGYGISRSSDTIEQKVERISQQLSKLSHPQQIKLTKKWGYIKKTILDYNSNVAPFIVIRVVHSLEQML